MFATFSSVVFFWFRGVLFLRGPARSVASRRLLRPWSRVSSCSVDAIVTSVEGLEPACLRIRPGQACDVVIAARQLSLRKMRARFSKTKKRTTICLAFALVLIPVHRHKSPATSGTTLRAALFTNHVIGAVPVKETGATQTAPRQQPMLIRHRSRARFGAQAAPQAGLASKM